MVVDDEESIRNLIVSAPAGVGYSVTAASNGKEAVDIYSEKHEMIALIIMDLIMPKMDGKSCLKGIMAINPRAKVIIVSGLVDPDQRGITDSAVRGVISKPFEIKTLMKTVRNVLDGN